MKKLLFLLLFIPLVTFGQDPIKVEIVPASSYRNPKLIAPVSNKVFLDAVDKSAERLKQEAATIAAGKTAEAKTKVKVPLSINIEDYTHIAIVDVLLSSGFRTSGGFKRVYGALKATPLTLINPTENKKKYRANTFYLRGLKNPKWLYLYYVAGYSGNNLTVSVILNDSENNKVFEASTTNMPWRTILTQIANFTKQDQVTINSYSSKQNQIEYKKEKAIKELKELKNLLDLELITQEEFDKKAVELKKIILGN